MKSDRAPRMSSHEYHECLERAASATRAADVAALRAEVLRRWEGDPRAQDLSELLHEHEVSLGGRDALRHLSRYDVTDDLITPPRRPIA